MVVFKLCTCISHKILSLDSHRTFESILFLVYNINFVTVVQKKKKKCCIIKSLPALRSQNMLQTSFALLFLCSVFLLTEHFDFSFIDNWLAGERRENRDRIFFAAKRRIFWNRTEYICNKQREKAEDVIVKIMYLICTTLSIHNEYQSAAVLMT